MYIFCVWKEHMDRKIETIWGVLVMQETDKLSINQQLVAMKKMLSTWFDVDLCISLWFGRQQLSWYRMMQGWIELGQTILNK